MRDAVLFRLKVEFARPFTLDQYDGRGLTRAEANWIANQVVRPRVAEVLARHTGTVLAEPKLKMQEPV